MGLPLTNADRMGENCGVVCKPGADAGVFVGGELCDHVGEASDNGVCGEGLADGNSTVP